MSFKIEKVNSLLVEEVSRILNKKRFLGLGFVTVTGADCAKDLRSTRIWISIFDEPEKNLKILKDHLYEIQRELNQRLEMKFTPRIHFQLDKSQGNLSRIDKLLDDEKKKLES